jgi:hypothetical protein
MSKRLNLTQIQKHDFKSWKSLPSRDELPDSDDKPVDKELQIVVATFLPDILAATMNR